MEGATDASDADSDDDGVLDGSEVNGYTLAAGDVTITGMNPLECDTDSDGLPDGLEVGISSKHPHTVAADDGGCFIPDDDTTTTTDPTNADTDGDGVLDGQEDLNKHGRLDDLETDPVDASTRHVSEVLSACESGNRGRREPAGAVLLFILSLALSRGRGHTSTA